MYTSVIPVHLNTQGEVCFGKPALSKAPSERKHVSEKVFPKKCFRTSISERDPTPQVRCVVVTSNLFLHPCWHGVGTFSLYLEPCWHVAWRRFLNFLNAPKFVPELHQHGSKMGPRWPQAGQGQLKMALRWPIKRATRRPKSARDGPQTATRPPKLAQDWPQDAP